MVLHKKCIVIISDLKLEGDLTIPFNAQAIILFVHGSGSSRSSMRNHYVAQILNDAGFATLLVDLLTLQEKSTDEKTKHLRFDIDLLTSRLVIITEWVLSNTETGDLKIGYFGSSTGAAAALIAAAKFGHKIKAIVSRGGRPDLAESRNVFESILAPTLFIIGGNDTPIIGLNKAALRRLSNASSKDIAVVPDAGHLFEEPGRVEIVANIATEWFECHLGSGKKFENRYRETSGLPSLFKHNLGIRLRFKDRTAAGNMLALTLSKYDTGDTIVIGIPRGGAIVASTVAKKLGADYDIVVPRKLRAHYNSENAIGAIMQDDSIYLENLSADVSSEYLEGEKQEQKREIERRLALYRPGLREYKIKDRTVILVDDGAATGATTIVAARWIKAKGPKRLVIAIPVASPKARDLLKKEADDLEIIRCPSNFKTVESFYRDFSPVSDQQLIHVLREMDVIKRQ